MKVIFFFLAIFGVGAAPVFSQQAAEAKKSYNDVGVDLQKSEDVWRAIQQFERASRSYGKQRRAAIVNLNQFRQAHDLPAHTLLHFGWQKGIGKFVHFMPRNSLFIVSIFAFVLAIALYFYRRDKYFQWSLILLFLGALLGLVGYFRSTYVQADELVIFVNDSELKDKPYDVSTDKQIVFEGQMAEVQQAYQDFYLVQTDTYEHGWVKKSAVVGIWDDEAK